MFVWKDENKREKRPRMAIFTKNAICWTEISVYSSTTHEKGACFENFMDFMNLFKNWAIPGLFFFYFRLFNTIDSK